MMLVVVLNVRTESNAGQKRFRRVAKVCEEVGLKVQNSVRAIRRWVLFHPTTIPAVQ
jgi:CRISPR/Cas system-associated endoribonuclease Cas2